MNRRLKDPWVRGQRLFTADELTRPDQPIRRPDCEIDLCRCLVPAIARSLDATYASDPSVKRGAIRASVIFASAASIQSTLVFQRKCDPNEARFRYLTWIEAMRIALKEIDVSQFNVVTDGVMRIGYSLHFLPWRCRLDRLSLSKLAFYPMDFRQWIAMSRYLVYRDDFFPLDPLGYLGSLRQRVHAFRHSSDRPPEVSAMPSNIRATTNDILFANHNNLDRWCWMTEEVLSQQLTARQIARRRNDWLNQLPTSDPFAEVASTRHVPGSDASVAK